MIVGSLEIKLFASLARLQSDMDKAGKTVDVAMSRIDKAIGTTKAAFTGLAGAFGAQSIVRLADEYKRFDSQLKLATKSASQYEEAYSRVVEISAKSQSDIGAIGVLYARLANNLRDAGASQQEVGDIAESISLSLRVANATVQETNSVMLQLSQSFGSGKLNGQEFLAVAEGAPALLRQVAKEMGVAYGELKNLSTEGKISADVLKRAWTNPEYLAGVREQVKQVGTIASAMTVLKNNLTVYIGEADKATNTSRTLSQAIIFLSENIDLLVNAGLAYLIVSFSKYVSGVMAAIAASRLKQAEMIKEAVVAERAAAAQIAAENAKAAAIANNAKASTLAYHKNAAALREQYAVMTTVAQRTTVLATAMGGLKAIFTALGGWVTVGIAALTLFVNFMNEKTDPMLERIRKKAKEMNDELAKTPSALKIAAASEFEQLANQRNRMQAELDARLKMQERYQKESQTGGMVGKLFADSAAKRNQEEILKLQNELNASLAVYQELVEQKVEAEKKLDPLKQAIAEYEAMASSYKTNTRELKAYNAEVAEYMAKASAAGVSSKIMAEELEAIRNKYPSLRKEAKETAKDLKETEEYRASLLQSSAEAMADLIRTSEELNKVQVDEAEVLSQLLYGYSEVSQAVRDYAQAQIDAKRAIDVQAGLAEAEEERLAKAQEQADSYTKIFEEQEKEYKELQIALIRSDKDRAKAKLELESEARIEQIRRSIEDADLAQQQIDRERELLDIRKQAVDESKDIYKELKEAINGYSREMSRSLAEFALSGKKSFGDMLNDFQVRLLSFVNQKFIFDPLFNALGGVLDNVKTGGGIFEFLGSSIGKLFANANGGIYSGSGISSYSNSVVSQPTVFPFAKGVGLMGEAGAEAIMPLQRDANGRLGVSAQGGSNITVNVIEAQGTKANIEQQQNADGTMSINVIIEQLYGVMNRDIQRGTGIAPTIERRYGLNRVAGAY